MSENITYANSRFKALLNYGATMAVVGWILVVVGGIMCFMGFTGCLASDPFAKLSGMMSFSIGVLVAIIGFLIVVNGEAVLCFVSIENNTFNTANSFSSMMDEKNSLKISSTEEKNDSENKYCYKCGEPIIEGYNFCRRCGIKLK